MRGVSETETDTDTHFPPEIHSVDVVVVVFLWV